MEERFRYLPNFDNALKGTNPKKPQVAKSLSDLLPVCSKLAPPVTAEPETPLDPAIRTGKLKNGMTFYVMGHQKPEQPQ